mmetsp:Transcript_16527/g.23159  ORF Transcript_16527/g.23159 Transcript_16527/m.23159 type:complete len:214 (+) Transcript_16527:64-705(+)
MTFGGVSSEKMEIIVIDRRDQVLTVKVKGGDEKVLAVKEKVRDNCNIRMDQINLKFKGILLDDGSALYNCGINEGDTILLDNGPSFQDLAVMYPYKKGRKAVRVWNTFDRNDIDRVVRNAREENLKEVEEGLSKWISSVLDFRVAPPLCLRLASGNELCMLLETVTGKLILGVHRNDGVIAQPHVGGASSAYSRLERALRSKRCPFPRVFFCL